MSDSVPALRDDADAKAWFYLDHREDIETWVGLRAEGRELLDKHLVGIGASLEELADAVDAELEMNDLGSGSWPSAGLRRPSWQHNGLGNVSVVIEWERSRLLTPGSNEWPYVAVRLPIDGVNDESRRRISDAIKPLRGQLGGSSSRTFPFWRYVRLTAGAPVDPDAYLQDVLDAFRQLWEAGAPILDALRLGPP